MSFRRRLLIDESRIEVSLFLSSSKERRTPLLPSRSLLHANYANCVARKYWNMSSSAGFLLSFGSSIVAPLSLLLEERHSSCDINSSMASTLPIADYRYVSCLHAFPLFVDVSWSSCFFIAYLSFSLHFFTSHVALLRQFVTIFRQYGDYAEDEYNHIPFVGHVLNNITAAASSSSDPSILAHVIALYSSLLKEWTESYLFESSSSSSSSSISSSYSSSSSSPSRALASSIRSNVMSLSLKALILSLFASDFDAAQHSLLMETRVVQFVQEMVAGTRVLKVSMNRLWFASSSSSSLCFSVFSFSSWWSYPVPTGSLSCSSFSPAFFLSSFTSSISFCHSVLLASPVPSFITPSELHASKSA